MSNDKTTEQDPTQDLEKRVAELETALGKLDVAVTDRINTINSQVADFKTKVSTELGAVTATVESLATKTDNNTASIAAFQKSVDGLVHQVSDAVSSVNRLDQKLVGLADWVSRIDTAIITAIQQTKDFAAKQAQQSVAHTDAVAVQIRDEIAALRTGLEIKIDQAAKSLPAHTHDLPASKSGPAVPVAA